MARKSFIQLLLQANTDFADNNTHAITPALLRGFMLDFIAAIMPAYAYLLKTVASAQIFGLTPTVVTFDTGNDSNSAETTTQVIAGRITRSEKGVSAINFAASIECPVNRSVVFQLFKNNVATQWQAAVNGIGNGRPVIVSFSAVDYADPAAFYDVRAVASNAGTSVIISNMALVLSIDPVRDFI